MRRHAAPVVVTATTHGNDTDWTAYAHTLSAALHDLAPDPALERGAVPKSSTFVTLNHNATTSLHMVWPFPREKSLDELEAEVKLFFDTPSNVDDDDVEVFALFVTLSVARLAPNYSAYNYVRIPVRTGDQRSLGVPVPLWVVEAENRDQTRLLAHAAVPKRLLERFSAPSNATPTPEALEEFVKEVLPPPSRHRGDFWYKIGCALHHTSTNNLDLFRTYTRRGDMGDKVLRNLEKKWEKMTSTRGSSGAVATWNTLQDIASQSPDDRTRERYIIWCQRHNRLV